MFYCIIVPLAWLVWHIAFRIHVVGREHLIQGRGFVLAPNHISAIDPVFVVLARFWGRRMIVLGKEELFEVNPLSPGFCAMWAWCRCTAARVTPPWYSRLSARCRRARAR